MVVVEVQVFVQGSLEFSSAREGFPVQEFVSEFVVEALDVSVLPRLSWFDKGRIDSFGKGERPKLGTIVRNDALGFAVDQE